MIGQPTEKRQKDLLAEAIRLHREGSHPEAEALYKEILAAEPNRADALCNLGTLYKATHRINEAMACWRQVLKNHPRHAIALNNLGNGFKDIGRMREAIECYRRALALRPNSAEMLSNMLVAMNYLEDISPDALFAAHLDFAERFEAPQKASWRPHDNDPDPQRQLRIGYVSGDFRNHAVARFIEPVLAAHDHGRFRVYCYSNHMVEDQVTKRLMASADCWRNIAGLSDDEAAALIRKDGIDILVDLSGHTGHHRLLTFARRPAPVQVAWIGYPNTTGLSAMDYRITNPLSDPPGESDHLFTEELIRLPFSALFDPPSGCPAVNELPALTAGHVTFASLAKVYKITPEMMETWADILERLPDAQLIALDIRSKAKEREFRAILERRGIAQERLRAMGRLPLSKYLALHHEIDIVLDSYPYGGGTTVNLGLWMGLPFITLHGPKRASRIAVRLLTQTGLQDLVVNSREDYVRAAVELARDLPRLAGIRRTLRDRYAALINPQQQIAGLEAAFREMWTRWCAAHGGPSNPGPAAA